MKTIKGYRVRLLKKDNINNIEDTLLKNRNIEKNSLNKYFNPDYSDLLDPFGLDGMQNAVDRIIEARTNKERVIIFGDYDVDGVSSTALLVRFFHEIGIEVSYRLPHRVKDGYGLKPYFFDDLIKNDVKLVITVDCGTRDIEAINHARELGIDLIITDHHAVPEEISGNILSIINPHKANCNYRNKLLSGSGVAFKLLHAISNKLFSEKETQAYLKHYIDFAMLGTIADCMPLTGENRTIAYLGLKQIKNSKSHGLKKLIEGNGKELDGDMIGFQVGPRLNAAGRMDSPYKALRVLLAGEENLEEALEEIENLNTKRKTSTEKFIIHANGNINPKSNVIIFDSTEIGHGILGLIASRLSEAHNKIAIVLKDEGERLVASLRGPECYNIVEILESMSELFEVFGGHKQAAGFTIKKTNFKIFKEKIEKLVSKQCQNIDIEKVLEVDAIIKFSSINNNLIKFIESLRPFGIGNPKPLFLSERIKFDSINFLGKENKHLKLFIHGLDIDFVAFGFGDYFKRIKESEKISIVFEVEKNVWNGKEKINLIIKDFIV